MHVSRRPRVKTSLLYFGLSAGFAAFIGGCATAPDDSDLAIIAASADANKLMIVDCLLPGQVRKLGSRAVYLTARRAVKVTASECEVRGGEYTAFDRADFRTSLNTWLPAANAGDPEAQNYVGEIYERGFGVTPDYQAAAQWYRKAADQGFARAQINLGHLYEKGLGVSKDPVRAINLYRQASGLGADSLAFSSSINQLQNQVQSSSQALSRAQNEAARARQEAASARQEAASARQEAADLRRRLNQLQDQIDNRSGNLDSAKRELEQARAKLRREREALRQKAIAQAAAAAAKPAAASPPQQVVVTPPPDNREVARLREQIAVKETEIARLSQDRGRISEEAALLKQRLASEGQDRAQLEKQLEQLSAQIADSQSVLQTQVDTTTKALREQQAGLEAARAALDKDRAELERKKLEQEALNSADLEQLNAKIRQQERQIQAQEEENQQIQQKIASLNEELSATKGKAQALEQEKVAIAQSLTQAQPTRGSGTPGPDAAATSSIGPTPEAPESEQTASSQLAGPVTPAISRLDFGRYYALIIGNNDYQYYPKLNTAVNDARAVADVLKSRYGFRTRVLLNANRATILQALNSYRSRLGENDNFLLYYAGHGEYDESNKHGHWIPVDAQPGDTTNWLANRAVTELLNVLPAKHVIVVADSCYSGTLTRAITTSADGGGRSAEKQEKWFNVMIRTRSRTALTSGGLAPVLDGGGGGNSVFARQFLRVLNDNKDVLEGPLLYLDVSRQVQRAAARIGVQQKPQYSFIQDAGDLGAPFFFKPRGA